MAHVFIGVGSNLDPERNVRAALRRLGSAAHITGISMFYCTEAVGKDDQPLFFNGVVEIETDLPPKMLKFAVLRKIEQELGRQRGEEKYASRTIDLDILLYDDLVLHEQDLQIPDPEIVSRPFLAIPLRELAPDLVLPDTGRSIYEIAGEFPGEMTSLHELTASLRKDCLHE